MALRGKALGIAGALLLLPSPPVEAGGFTLTTFGGGAAADRTDNPRKAMRRRVWRVTCAVL